MQDSYYAEASEDEVHRTIMANRGVLMEHTTRAVLPEGMSREEGREIPLVEEPLLVGDFHRVVLRTRATTITVFVLPDGDVTLRVDRDGKLMHVVDVEPEPEATRVTDPTCTCPACSERRARRTLN